MNILKGLRKKDNLRQADMAELLNITVPAYNQKENNKRPFTINECKIISDFFGEPIEAIFFDNGVNKNETKVS